MIGARPKAAPYQREARKECCRRFLTMSNCLSTWLSTGPIDAVYGLGKAL